MKITYEDRNAATAGHSVRGQDKIDRYKWNTLPPMGEFVFIEKQDLDIDHSYQRDKIDEHKLNTIAANWSWVSCGAISVAERNGRWYVMDGQHRKLAADKRSDITELPCMVFDLNSKEKEARAFVELNTNKTTVAGKDRFKALLIAKEQSAIRLKSIIESTGHAIGNSKNVKYIDCILTLWKAFKRNEKNFINLWPLVSDVCSDSFIVDKLFRGIWGAELIANKQNASITNEPYRSVLVYTGGSALVETITRKCIEVGKGGEKIEGMAVAQFLNSQRSITKKHKLEIK